MAGSAMGLMGQERFNKGKAPGMAKTTITYIVGIAKAIGEITGDPQLSAIAAGLGSRLPQEAPGGKPMDVPAKDPTAEEPPVPPPVA